MSVDSVKNRDFPFDVSAVLVSYNTRALTMRAIDELQRHRGRRLMETWVVDNASTDGTAQQIADLHRETRLLVNQQNQGFGVANNQAMSKARGKYLLLINTDAFVHAGAIDALVDRIESDPQIGVVGPRLLNGDGSVQQSCFAFPSPMHAWLENLWLSSFKRQRAHVGNYGSWAHDTAQEVDWVSGACLLVRRELFETLGGFDERFFMYSEETDWQWRMRQHGVRIAFEPKAIVTHLGGASGSATALGANSHFFQSLDYYELKNHGLVGLISVRLAMAIGCTLRLMLWCGAWLLRPTRRVIAVAKMRLHVWLIARQITNWQVMLPHRKINGRIA